MKRNCERCGEQFEVVVGKRGAGHRRRFCTENCRKRYCEERKRATCVDCGAVLGAGSGFPSGWSRCRLCEGKHQRAAHADRDEQIVRWWKEGLSHPEICKRLGWYEGRLAKEMDLLRGYGYDLPYRHQGEVIGKKFAHLRRAA